MNRINFFKLNQRLASIFAVLLGFSLAISTAFDTLFLVLLLITAILGWCCQYHRLVLQNSVAQAALLLFGVLLIGCFYGINEPSAGLKVLTKYDDLILVVLLLPIFAQAQMRGFGQAAFMTAMALTLILSYLIWLGVFQHTALFSSRLPSNPVVFKLQITHGILMGFAAFMFAVYAVNTAGKGRGLLVAAAILATCNVLLMIQGRTGYLVLIALGIYLIVALFHWRGLAFGLALIIVALAVAYTTSATLQTRVNLAIDEAQTWQPMQGNNEHSSIGTRMDYYTNTIKIIQKNPLFGTGTGGFEAAYAKEISGTAMAHSNNPHNQFLLFLAQVGVIGLAAFLYLLWVAWREATRLPTMTETMLARGLLITITTGCLFNSLLLDHTEGLFFAWFCGLLFAGLPTNQKVTTV